VEFPLFLSRGTSSELRISLVPIEILPKPYSNPLHIAMEYRRALDTGKYQNQTELAKSLNVTPSRVNQYLRLLKLPDKVKKEIGNGKVESTERNLRRKLTNGEQPETKG